MTKTRKPAAWLMIILMVLISLTIAGLAGCRLSRQTSFPTLGPGLTWQTDGTDGTETQPDPTGTVSEPIFLRLAVPYEKETAEALRLLFLARESGLINDERGSSIGHQVSLEDLRQFDAPLVFDVTTVSADVGVTSDQFRAWQASASLPDLIYCSAAAAAPGLSRLLALDDLLYEHALLSPAHIYTAAADVLRRGQSLYGIPCLASTPMILYETALLDQLQVRTPELFWTWSEWAQWLADVQAGLSAIGLGAAPQDLSGLAEDPEALQDLLEKAVFIFSDLTEFLPFVTASLSAADGWGMWNGYTFELDSPVFRTSAAWLRQQAQAGYGLHHLDDAMRQIALAGADSRLNDRVICRVIDSSELPEWHQRDDQNVSESLLPFGPLQDRPSDGSNGEARERFPIQVRCLAVSRLTAEPELVSRLAVFLALDPDALLMQSRFQLYEGLFPLVRDPLVWSNMVGRQTYGSRLQAVRPYLADAYTSGQQVVASWDKIMNDAFRQAGGLYLAAGSEDEREQAFSRIVSTAVQILHEGG